MTLATEAKRIRRQLPVQYGLQILEVLRLLWKMMDYLFGKRPAPALQWLVPKAGNPWGAFPISSGQRETPSYFRGHDRPPSSFRAKTVLLPRGRSSTRPGTLLKHQIRIRTFAYWDNEGVEFMEVDLVSHDGGNASGDFACTLTLTDVATGWTELHAVPIRARRWVLGALSVLMSRLPFPLRGLDSDNGSEFINHHLVQFCSDHGITFTRSRPENKNENCHVEQKNGAVVRKMVGYVRYDTPREADLLNWLTKTWDCASIASSHPSLSLWRNSGRGPGSGSPTIFPRLPGRGSCSSGSRKKPPPTKRFVKPSPV